MCFGVIRLDADRFAKGCFSPRLISGLEPESAQAVVRRRQVRLQLDRFLQCGNCILFMPLLQVNQAQLVPCGKVIRRDL